MTNSDNKLDPRSRFIVVFTVLSMIPAFFGFVLSFERNSAVGFLSVLVVTVAVDIVVILLAVRSTGGKGNLQAPTPRRSTMALGGAGLALITTTFVLAVSESGSAFVRTLSSILGALLLLVAANRIRHDGRRATDGRSVSDTASNLQ